MSNSYSELLRDPRWQQKRLRIFDRDGWKCSVCSRKDRTLIVHHRVYSGKPWETNDEDLETLCEGCHNVVTEMEEVFGRRNVPAVFWCIAYEILASGGAEEDKFVRDNMKTMWAGIFHELRNRQIKMWKESQKHPLT
jgi:hypothetical protein